jgi:hypothetical protein
MHTSFGNLAEWLADMEQYRWFGVAGKGPNPYCGMPSAVGQL